MHKKNISDDAIVLGRIDFGEKDRILTIITPSNGKLKVIAKAVRAGKSKLAGGIELFADNHVVLVRGRSDLYTLTSAKMKSFFGDNISKDIDKSAFAYSCLSIVNKVTPDGSGEDYYEFLLEVLTLLNNPELPIDQIKIYINLKLLELIGVTPNLNTLSDGSNMSQDAKYSFDFDHQCFFVNKNGEFTADHIKILRYHSGRTQFKTIQNCSNDLSADCKILLSKLIEYQMS